MIYNNDVWTVLHITFKIGDGFLCPIRKNTKHFYGHKKLWWSENTTKALGVPDIVLPERDKPSGNVPLSMLHVMGVSPVAASVWLYAVPTVPPDKESVVIAGAVAVSSLPHDTAASPITIMAAKSHTFCACFILNTPLVLLYMQSRNTYGVLPIEND